MNNINPYKPPKSITVSGARERANEYSTKIDRINSQLRKLTVIASLFIPFVVVLKMDKSQSFEEFSKYGHYYVLVLMVIVLSFYVYIAKLAKNIGQSRIVWLGATIIFSPISFPVSFFIMRRNVKRKLQELEIYTTYKETQKPNV